MSRPELFARHRHGQRRDGGPPGEHRCGDAARAERRFLLFVGEPGYLGLLQCRSQAQRIGDACLAEMGSFKASLGGRAKIQAGIDSAFPR